MLPGTRCRSTRMRHRLLLIAFLSFPLGCQGRRPGPLDDQQRHALIDTVLTIFDSLAAVHRDHPDTAILRALHPPADTLQFVEGSVIEALTGDSLFRRVRALHVPVSAMQQRFTDRTAQLLDANHAVLTAAEQVDWSDAKGVHRYSGLLTITVSRLRDRWVVRSYRGS